MHENIIMLDVDGKRWMVCQFVINLSSKDDLTNAIKSMKEMSKTEEEKPKTENP